MIFTSPHGIHPGTPVLLTPRRGFPVSTYAVVEKSISPLVAVVIVTADSGGRRRGQRYTAPLGCLTARHRAQHRKPQESRPRIARWWAR